MYSVKQINAMKDGLLSNGMVLKPLAWRDFSLDHYLGRVNSRSEILNRMEACFYPRYLTDQGFRPDLAKWNIVTGNV